MSVRPAQALWYASMNRVIALACAVDPLAAKTCWLVGTKLDSLQDDDRRVRFEALCRARGQEPILISGVTGAGLRPLVFKVAEALAELRRA